MTIRKPLNRSLIVSGWIIATVSIVAFWYYAVGCQWANELDSLFSGLAFAALIATVFLQMEELQETRDQLKRSAIAQENSETALKKQIYATNLASLVDGYSAILEYYDRIDGRRTSVEGEQLKHVRVRLKELMDHLEAETFGGNQDRPADWRRV